MKTKEEVAKKKKNLIISMLFAMLLFSITYSVVIAQFQNPLSDFSIHTNTARLLVEEGVGVLLKEAACPLFQLLVALVSIVLHAPYESAAAIVTGLLNVLTYAFVCKYFLHKNKDVSAEIIAFSCLFMLMGPLYVPWFNPDVYLGQGSPNIWHNPTTMCIRPFAIITYLLIVEILEKYERKEVIEKKKWFYLVLLIMVCNLAKPSFLQIVVPGLGIYLIILLIRSKGKAFLFCLQLALSFVPGVVVLLWQYLVSFMISSSAGEGGGIGISLFEVLAAYTPNLPISMLLVFSFPIYIMVTNFKYITKIDVQLSIFMCLSGFLEAATLVEVGPRRLHGNFGWGYILSMFFVYLTAVKYFIQQNRRYDYENTRERVVVVVGWIFIVIQLFVGIHYISIMS